jgi:hypothetical protein
MEGQLTLDLRKCRKDELNEVLDYVNNYLRCKRKPFLKIYTDKLISDYEKEGVFPEFSNSVIGKYQKAELENVVRELYQVEPKIFASLNNTQKSTFIRLLNLILESGENDGLFQILSQIIELDEVERKELSEILKVSKLDNIVKTIKLIQDRFKAVNQLKEFENAAHHGERSLAHKSGNFKIYVKLWSEIIDEFECSHNFLNERLLIEREHLFVEDKTAAEILNSSQKNTALQKPELKII